ncbi:MAG TPA: DegT/DnrJ/EryC1/StrS family aminotransferase [Candidatus Saccharimonadales bacterium]|jgi:dTDP-4-amino-4,6-dideoxygalactose transaminase|nr:DegT/DnrJ/EryC1/StrS family aminotransferase [Candidatus Saccharimonadales bacterium]
MELTSTVASKARVNISFFDLQAQFAKIRIEILQAVETVLESQHFILGQQVELFEKEAAAFIRVPHAVGCASGTDALYLALCAQGIGPGDEVITTPFTFVATAGSIARTGAKPVFVDILPETFNINPALIEQAVTTNTKALLPVHLFGLSAAMDPIMAIAKKHSLAVIEDAAQAIGATYHGRMIGSIGDFGCFSFFPSKNLGCAGDGGMVTTRHKSMADRLNLLRAHGTRKKYHSEIIGMNSRLDALQAAILRVKLRHLDSWTKSRQERATLYSELFDQYKLSNMIVAPQAPSQFGHVYNQYVIRCENRDSLRNYLQDQGIPTAIYYPEPLHLQPAFDYLKYAKGSMPESEKACDDSLALPVYPELPLEDQERVVQAIADFYKSKDRSMRENLKHE